MMSPKLFMLSLALCHLVSAQSVCLSPITTDPAANKATCCPSSSSLGEEPVDDTIYEYKCGYYAKGSYLSGPHSSASALDCARKCAVAATAETPSHQPILSFLICAVIKLDGGDQLARHLTKRGVQTHSPSTYLVPSSFLPLYCYFDSDRRTAVGYAIRNTRFGSLRTLFFATVTDLTALISPLPLPLKE
ncbi:hypothetical protein BP00DRAFT_121784 [Aspergillus indologenus CBS 114.80]|uniref:WSC domain-containing protein n=1 Tax=Aspergillus indologenus CBS 114.80 TaxID=1450541 RepID=A0A2V5JCW8_9EURO|nr:hypothetical protein BP00DRAFT_121784 [Aspergillus indologenus CBS 114.80]